MTIVPGEQEVLQGAGRGEQQQAGRPRASVWPGEPGSRCLPGMGRNVELPQLLPIKQGWHFRERQRRWLPALEVSVWPLSQRCLPSPSPLTSKDWTKAPTGPLSSCLVPQWGHSGALGQASLEGTSSSPSRVPLAEAFACVGGGSGCGDNSWQPGQHF